MYNEWYHRVAEAMVKEFQAEGKECELIYLKNGYIIRFTGRGV